MDKYEYKLRADEIKTLIGEGRYAEAVQIADTIDWKKVKSVRMLCTISDIYKINKRYEESREILLIANSHYPDGRYIIYSLCELSIKLQDIVQAIEYFKEFVRIAPHNTSRYILQYKLYVAQDVSLEERIAVLQEFKKHDYREKWGYELAFLYHRVGLTTECIEECDELFLWFSGGRFVMKALELKMLHEPLSPEQQKVYDRYKAGLVEFANKGREKAAEEYDDERDEMGHDEARQNAAEDGEFHVKTVDVGQYNTINLQEVIAESLKELQRNPASRRVPQDTRVMREQPERSAPVSRPVSQDTLVAGIQPGRPAPASVPADRLADESTAETGILGITEEDLNDYEEPDTARDRDAGELRDPARDRQEVTGEPEKPAASKATAGEGNAAFEDSLRQTASSIATDETIWMPSIDEMAAYASRQEISDRTIAQATGELPMDLPINTIKETPKPDPVREALKQSPEQPAEPAEEDLPAETPEKRLIDELQTEVGQARDEVRRIRAAERRAELKSREKQGGVREVSSDTRRLGQTREYVPVAQRMDQMVQAALSDRTEVTGPNGKRLSAPVPREVLAGGTRGDQRPEHLVIRPDNQGPGDPFDELLTQGTDGQISMAVDGDGSLDRQITGQLNINDYIAGWDKRTDYLQKRQKENVRAHVTRRTDELFKNYDEKQKHDLQHQLEEASEEAIRKEAAQDQKGGVREVGAEQTAPSQKEEQQIPPADKPKTPDQTDAGVTQEAQSAGESKETAAADAAKKAGTTDKMSPEQIAHQLAILEGRITPDTPMDAPTIKADEQILKNAEGEAAQPVPDENAVENAVSTGEETETPETSDGEADQTADSEQTEQSPSDVDEALRVMTPEEKALFGPYIHRKRSRQQIVNAIDKLSMAAYAGNAIITGEEGAGTINLAKGLIRSVQLSDSNFSGQIAKISGHAMNRKRVDAIIEKLEGGALIIQGASGMNNETTKALLKALESENKGIIVILEDTRKGAEKFIKRHPEVQDCFDVRVDVEALATRELVAYAKQYALEREYSMDEFAILALHKRIDELQTAEHEVTIAEVRDIVEEAIHRANKKNPGHFFDILLQKRYDDDDMIVLRERDFLR
ncbi:MAG: hypothetical protein II800_03225 [Lachnospiraceae bacterium]|nr:hypothetical protein [Lachnospiraceae bacterium]